MQIGQDLRYGLRKLRRSPGFALASFFSLRGGVRVVAWRSERLNASG